MHSSSYNLKRSKKNIMKYFSVLIIFAMLFSFFPKNVSAFTSLISETFNGFTPGTLTGLPTTGTGVWKTSGTAPTMNIVDDTALGRKYLSLSNSTANSSYFGQNFTSVQTNGLVYEFDVNDPSSTLGASILMYNNATAINTGTLSLRMTMTAGKFTLYSGTTATAIGTYNTSSWYHVRASFNIPNKTFAFKIVDLSNNSTVYENSSVVFNGSATQIGGITYQIDKSGGALNLDNVCVSSINTSLSGLNLTGTTLNTPNTFSSTTTSYTADSASSVANVTFNPTAAVPDDVTISVNGTNVTSGDSTSVSIASVPALGSLTVPVTVTSNAYQNISTTYNFTINKLKSYPDPTSVVATPLNDRLLLTWVNPLDAAYTATRIYSSSNQLITMIDGSDNQAVIDGLSNGTNYSFTVKGYFSADDAESTGVGISGTPTAAELANAHAIPTDSKVLLTWEQPSDSEYSHTNIYTVNADSSMQLTKTVSQGVYEAVLDGLQNGTNYSFVLKGVYSDVSTATEAETTGVSLSAAPFAIQAHQMEALDRGLVAMKRDDGIYLGWRMFGNDPSDISFNIYRDGIKITSSPITTSTNFLDASGTDSSLYSVAPVIGGIEGEKSAQVKVVTKNYLSIPLKVPQGGTTLDGLPYTYSANDCSVGDLDGDGQYEMIVKWYPSNAHDNSEAGLTGNVYLDAYKLDGTFMWRIDLGRNIRAGAHYTQFMVYDLDGDGKAEIACKTADATVDGQGNVIGDINADYRVTDSTSGSYGKVLTGPEYLTIFNGQTGAAMTTVDYEPSRGDINTWGKSGDNGNRVDRFLATIAYLDGQRPSLVMCRGYYGRTVLVAYNWREGQLTKVWTFDSNTPGNSAYAGQGNHNLTAADVDYDGKDEIIYGAMTIDDNGTGIYSTGIGHGDALHVSNLDPSTSDLETFKTNEDTPGAMLVNSRTGKILWFIPTPSDCGRGVAADIDPNYPGDEMWAAGGVGLRDSKGNLISSTVPQYNGTNTYNFAIWWDGDLLRELLDGYDNTSVTTPPFIAKYNYATGTTSALLTADGAYSNNGTKANPNLQADILGDWREEAVWRSADSSELRIYTTTDLTDHRIYTLMHDLQYRESVAWQNVGYNQPPHTSFYLGEGMTSVPTPKMYTVAAALSDTTAPTVPANLSSSDKTTTSVSLSWDAATDDTGVTGYEIYVNGSTTPTAVINSLSYTVTGLTSGTTYTFTVKAVDAAGNRSQASSSLEVKTEEPSSTADATAPTVPANLSSSDKTTTSVSLSWDAATDDTGVTGYEIYVNGSTTPTAVINSLSYTVTGLTSGTTYTFTVKAVDSSGNKSDASNSLEVTTVHKSSSGSSSNTNSGTVVTPVDSTKPVLDSTTGEAKAVYNDEAVKNVIDEATAGADGVKVVEFDIPKVEGASTYTLTLSPKALSTSSADQKLEYNSALGTVIISDSIISNNASAQQLNISLSEVKKESLSEEAKQIIGDRPVLNLEITADGKTIETSDSASVLVSIPYNPTAEELNNHENIVVQSIDKSGNAKPVSNGKYDPSTGMVNFTTNSLDKYAVSYVTKSFDDVAGYDWAKKQIEVLATKGIIKGSSDKTFNPGENITRADFTMLLVNTLGLNAKTDTNFSDISKSDYYYQALGIAKALGIVSGTGDGKFNPDESISRQDMMVITANALKSAKKLTANSSNSDLTGFSDRQAVSSYAVDQIAALVKDGLVKGDNGVINPFGNSTRAEVAVLLYRLYNK